MPNPANLLCLPSHRLSSTEPSVSATPSIQSMPADLRFHPYSQLSLAKSANQDDKANVTSAGNKFIAQMCLGDCWLKSGDDREGIAREVLLSVNTAARAAGRHETAETAKLLGMVSRCVHVLP